MKTSLMLFVSFQEKLASDLYDIFKIIDEGQLLGKRLF